MSVPIYARKGLKRPSLNPLLFGVVVNTDADWSKADADWSLNPLLFGVVVYTHRIVRGTSASVLIP